MALFHKDNPLDALKRKDRYRDLGFLGKGRLADISSSFDSYLNRIVAIKHLRKDNLSKPELVRSFLNETKLVSYLDHPGVVSIYDAFLLDDSEPCYTMKLIKGNPLQWEIKTKSRGQLFAIFTKLCETLSYVHDKGVVHLDLNPDNIMLGQYGEVLITDWGNARLYDAKPYHDYLKLVRDAPPPPIEESGIPGQGTAQYMSPEQTQGDREALTPASDIFSLGVIFFELMTGRLPFSGIDKDALFLQIRTTNPPHLHEANPEIPWRLSQICANMLQKDPFNRYHSFHEVLIDIDRFNNSGEAFSLHRFGPDDVIFREGDPGDYAFTVVSGSVEVLRQIDGKQKVIASFGPGETVGELAIFTGEARTGTVRAIEPNTVIRVMAREAVEQELQKLSPWVSRMITTLSERFIDLSRKAHK